MLCRWCTLTKEEIVAAWTGAGPFDVPADRLRKADRVLELLRECQCGNARTQRAAMSELQRQGVHAIQNSFLRLHGFEFSTVHIEILHSFIGGTTLNMLSRLQSSLQHVACVQFPLLPPAEREKRASDLARGWGKAFQQAFSELPALPLVRNRNSFPYWDGRTGEMHSAMHNIHLLLPTCFALVVLGCDATAPFTTWLRILILVLSSPTYSPQVIAKVKSLLLQFRHHLRFLQQTAPNTFFGPKIHDLQHLEMMMAEHMSLRRLSAQGGERFFRLMKDMFRRTHRRGSTIYQCLADVFDRECYREELLATQENSTRNNKDRTLTAEVKVPPPPLRAVVHNWVKHTYPGFICRTITFFSTWWYRFSSFHPQERIVVGSSVEVALADGKCYGQVIQFCRLEPIGTDFDDLDVAIVKLYDLAPACGLLTCASCMCLSPLAEHVRMTTDDQLDAFETCYLTPLPLYPDLVHKDLKFVVTSFHSLFRVSELAEEEEGAGGREDGGGDAE